MFSSSGILRGMSRNGIAALIAATASAVLPAAAADDLKCSKCVDTKDIAKKAVTKNRIAKGAVDGKRIRAAR